MCIGPIVQRVREINGSCGSRGSDCAIDAVSIDWKIRSHRPALNVLIVSLRVERITSEWQFELNSMSY